MEVFSLRPGLCDGERASRGFRLLRTREERQREREQKFFFSSLPNQKAVMSSFSDDEDMAGYSDDDYGMSSDGDQSYGEVEELPVASKVSLKSKSCFGPRCFDAFHPLPSVVSSILVSLSPCSLLLFCPSFAIGSLERERLCALVGR